MSVYQPAVVRLTRVQIYSGLWAYSEKVGHTSLVTILQLSLYFRGKATKAIDDEAEEDTEEGTVMDEDEELELKTSESTRCALSPLSKFLSLSLPVASERGVWRVRKRRRPENGWR